MEGFKAQATLEFIVQYSSELIILAAAVAAVYLISIPSGQQTLGNSPSYCYITPNLNCYQLIVTSNAVATSITVFFTNNIGKSIYLPSNSLYVAPTAASSFTAGTCNTTVLKSGKSASCTVSLQNFKISTGIQIEPSFFVSYKVCNDASCSNPNTLQTINTSGSATSFAVTSTISTSTTSTTTTSSTTSTTSTTTILPQLTVYASASSGVIFLGSSSTLTATASGGVSPYTYNWYEEAPGLSSYTAIPGATSTSYIFQAPYQDGTYSFIASATDSESPAHTSNSLPVNVIVKSGGTYAYVVDTVSNNVSIVDTSTNTVVGTIPKSQKPVSLNGFEDVAVAPSGTYAYTTNFLPNNVSIIDTATNTVVGQINSANFDGPTGVAFAPSGTYAYVENYNANTTTIISTATNSVVGQITGLAYPMFVAFAPSGTYAYVTDYNSTNVTIISTATNSVTGNIVGMSYNGTVGAEGIAFAPNGTYAYVVYSNIDNVSIIDTATNSIDVISVNPEAPAQNGYGTVGFNYPVGVAFSPSGTYAYISNSGSNNIVIVNTITTFITNSINSTEPLNSTNVTGILNDPMGIAFAPNGTYAYVSNYGSGALSVINTATNTVLNSIPQSVTPFYEPTGVAFSPSGTYAYIANTANILIVNTATNTVTGAINSGLGIPTRTLVLDVAFAPNGTYAYATSYPAHNISIINTATNSVTGHISFGANYPVAVAFSPSGTYAYATDVNSSSSSGPGYSHDNVIIINTATNTITGLIKGNFDNPQGVAFAPNGAYAYVVNLVSGIGAPNVSIINTATNSVTGAINSNSLFNSLGVAFAPNGAYAYVTNAYSGTAPHTANLYGNMIIINTATNSVTGAINSGFNYPYAVAISP